MENENSKKFVGAAESNAASVREMAETFARDSAAREAALEREAAERATHLALIERQTIAFEKLAEAVARISHYRDCIMNPDSPRRQKPETKP